MKRLKELGFKKIKTEPGFHMYELTPARLPQVEEPSTEKRTSLQARKHTSTQAHKHTSLTNK
jgi:hypothetical protein